MPATSPVVKEADEHFKFVDSRLFARLHDGSVQPLRVVLKNGQRLMGEAKGIARGTHGDAGNLPHACGIILLLTAQGEIEVEKLP